MVRVIAHVFHEEERSKALALLTEEASTPGYVIGETDEEGISDLEQSGVVVERVEEAVHLFETPSAYQSGSALVGAPIEAADQPPPGDRYVLGINGPLIDDWRAQLAAEGVEFHYLVEQGVYAVQLPSDKVEIVRQLPFVVGVAPHDATDAAPLGPGLVGGPAKPGPPRMRVMDVVLHGSGGTNAFEAWLEERHVTVIGKGRRKIRFYLPDPSPIEDEIQKRTDVVRTFDEYHAPHFTNDVARQLLGVDSQQGTTVLTGLGQTVAIADSGIDATHPDFGDRIKVVIARGRPGDGTDPHGHGTHVAGSLVGDGTGSNGQIKGTAPEAELVFQSLLDAEGKLGGLPVDLHDLFEEAYQQGARVHNDSWGADVESEYVVDADEADEYVYEHKDMLIVTSAGNAGRDGGRNEPPGEVDLLSVGSLAAAKNVITVGASRTRRTSGGFADRLYGGIWPEKFTSPPISQETVSGDPEKLAGFSSRGPLVVEQTKPDVVAPGTDIVSARSSKAPLSHFWAAYDDLYAYMGGTSMSAPLVAGVAALVRQYYAATRGHDNPSAALVKATLINGTRRLEGAGATPWQQAFPNPHQGFGCVYIPTTIPEKDDFSLEFIDAWTDPELQFTKSGQFRGYSLDTPGGHELRFCLAYTDVAARGLQNNLNLFVERLDTGHKYLGNEDRVTNLRVPDPVNNVEVVRIEDPDPGTYIAWIQAKNLLSIPQDFALVISGALASGLSAAKP